MKRDPKHDHQEYLQGERNGLPYEDCDGELLQWMILLVLLWVLSHLFLLLAIAATLNGLCSWLLCDLVLAKDGGQEED